MSEPRPRVGEPFNPFRGICGFYPPDTVGAQRARRRTIGGKRTISTNRKNTDLTDGQKRLYERLVRFAGRDGRCFPSQERLAECLGKSERQIRYDLEALQRFGLIRSRKRDGKRFNTYEFLWHEIFDRQSIAAHENEQSDSANDLTGSPLPLKANGSNPRPASYDNLSGKIAHFDRQHIAVESSQEICTEKSSSSSSAVVDGQRQRDDDDDRSISSIKTEWSAEDRERFASWMRAQLPFGTMGANFGPLPDLVESCRKAMPAWSVDDAIHAFEVNMAASPSRPQGYRWFPAVARDLYTRLGGIAPAKPSEEVQPERRLYECTDCLDQGSVSGGYCHCRAGTRLENERRERRERREIEMLRAKSGEQSERWVPHYGRLRDSSEFCSLETRFVISEIDEREEILRRLDAGESVSEIIAAIGPDGTQDKVPAL